MTSLGSNARTKNFVCETINTISKPVQDAYINTLHYTALDPPVGGGGGITNPLTDDLDANDKDIFNVETLNTALKPIQNAYVNTLHYTALDPPIGGGGGGVSNPMTETLNANNKAIENVKVITADVCLATNVGTDNLDCIQLQISDPAIMGTPDLPIDVGGDAVTIDLTGKSRGIFYLFSATSMVFSFEIETGVDNALQNGTLILDTANYGINSVVPSLIGKNIRTNTTDNSKIIIGLQYDTFVTAVQAQRVNIIYMIDDM